MSQLEPIIEESMIQYAGAVLQSRALIDVRDGLKPSARQILYCMDMCKYTADKPFQASAAVVGDAMKYFYIHGDASCLGVIMRAGQPFAMRYPLVDVGGNCGTLIDSGNWAAARYTKSRLSKIASYLFEDIKKDTISEWRDNFSDTEQYPAVLPSKGFYNLVNGTQGIGIGMASSIPQFNLKELNNALIYLIDHPDCSFEEIYCAPDFATGAILYNENEVKESLKNGTGAACKLRSVIEFDNAEKCFIVKEIPYGVYTNTICGELEEICNSEENPGIDRFNDLTGSTPLIKIYISKKNNPDTVLRYLYKNTSLQSYYGINFTMLDNGRFPRVFTWKQTLQAHIDHEKVVYRNAFQYDLNKIEARIHIIDGLLICLANINDVVNVIKNSASTTEAAANLQKQFLLDDAQTKAVLDMKLSRLAHLEVKKLQDEQKDLQSQAEHIQQILNDEQLFNNELKNNWRAVANKYGDARRTKVISLAMKDDEPIEIKQLQISITNQNRIFAMQTSNLYTQKRGGVGTKFKLEKGEYITDTKTVATNEEILFFTQLGNVYHYRASNITLEDKIYISSLIPLKNDENVCAITAASKKNAKSHIMFITRNGMVKKSDITEYNINRNAALKAITLDESDEIVDVLCINEEDIGMLTSTGNFLIIHTDDIRAIGRVAKGVKGIKLNDGDTVVSARVVPANTKSIASVSGNGLFKQTDMTEFTVQGRDTKGSKIQKLNDGDWMADFYPICDQSDLLIAATNSCIKLTIADIPVFSKGALGNKSIKLNPNDNVVRISIY